MIFTILEVCKSITKAVLARLPWVTIKELLLLVRLDFYAQKII